MAFFGYKEIPANTVAEMEARTSNTVTKWHGARMPWIHVMSMSNKCSGFSEFWSGNINATGYLPDYSRPKPVIDSIEVKKQGELGTTKRVSIKFKAYTDEQLAAIATCYLIPGMSIRVQYGWNFQALNGARSPKPITKVLLDTEAVVAMNELTDQYACYEGTQGRVIDFSISFVKEGYWDISVEMVSASATISNVKIKNHSSGCVCEDGSEEPANEEPAEDKEKTNGTVDNITAALNEIIDRTPNALRDLKKAKEKYTLLYRGYDRDEKGNEDASGWLGSWSFGGLGDGIGDQITEYISYGLLEEIITSQVQNKTKEGKPTDFVADSTGSELSAPKLKVKDKPYDLFCADPRIAYIPGGALTLKGGQRVPLALENGKLEPTKVLVSALYAKKLLAQMSGEQDSVMSYLQNLWNDINKACGSPWEIEMVTKKPEAGDTLVKVSVADIKGNANRGQKEYVFKANSKQSNVRDLKMDLKMTEAMKSQALYMNQETPPKTTDGCNNRFKLFSGKMGGVINQGMPVNTQPAPSLCVGEGKCSDKPEKKTFQEKLDILSGTGTGEGVTNANVSSLVSDMVDGLSNKDEKAANCKDVIIPIELGITVDGIGGFRFGQGVSCDRLPLGFKEALIHQVTAVEHSITTTDWTTTITTKARLRS